jgi:hypothetical protein
MIALDADDAGRRYVAKLVPMLLAAGIKPFLVGLRGGYDLADELAEVPDADARGEWIANTIMDAAAAAEEASPGMEAAALLDAIDGYMARYVVLPGGNEATALALFVAHTHAIEAAHATPYLIVLSPEKRSGKTLLLEVLALLVARPWRIVAASEAAMLGKISKDRPTLLLDEIDAIWLDPHRARSDTVRLDAQGLQARSRNRGRLQALPANATRGASARRIIRWNKRCC